MAKKFTHLHVHSEYSLLDGLSNLKKLISYVKEKGMDSIAITDHGVMYGIIEFYKQALKEEIKPIIGIEAYTTNVDHKERPERKDFQNFQHLCCMFHLPGSQTFLLFYEIQLSTTPYFVWFYRVSLSVPRALCLRLCF